MALYYKHLLTKALVAIQFNRAKNRMSCRVIPSDIIEEELPEHENEDPNERLSNARNRKI